MRLFLYEYATAQRKSVSLPVSVRREGRAMFEALREDARALPGVEVVTLAPTDCEEDQFRVLARGCDLALIVAPEFDGLLERRCRWVEEVSGRLLGPSSSGVRRAADKWELFNVWRRQRVRTPETWLPAEGLPDSTRGPILKKHRYGAGSLGVSFWHSEPLGPEHILQQWVPGLIVSVALIVDSHGGIHPLLPGEQRISGDGAFTYLGGRLPLAEPYASRLMRLACAAVAAVNEDKVQLVGYVGVDAILGDAGDGSRDYVLEINPRLTTSYVGLRKATPMNLLDLMRRAVTGESVPAVEWRDVPVEFSADGRAMNPPFERLERSS